MLEVTRTGFILRKPEGLPILGMSGYVMFDSREEAERAAPNYGLDHRHVEGPLEITTFEREHGNSPATA